MSRVYSNAQIPYAGQQHSGFLPSAVFRVERSLAFEPEVQYTDGPGGSDSKGGRRATSGIGLLSYPMSDHLKASIESQPAPRTPSAGEKDWTGGGL